MERSQDCTTRDSRIEYPSGYSLNIPFRAALTGLKVFQKSIRFYQIFKSGSQRSERRYRFRDRFGYWFEQSISNDNRRKIESWNSSFIILLGL